MRMTESFILGAVVIAVFSVASWIYAMNHRVVGKTRAGYHLWHAQEFCKRTEALNPGWKCPDMDALADDVFKRINEE